LMRSKTPLVLCPRCGNEPKRYADGRRDRHCKAYIDGRVPRKNPALHRRKDWVSLRNKKRRKRYSDENRRKRWSLPSASG